MLVRISPEWACIKKYNLTTIIVLYIREGFSFFNLHMIEVFYENNVSYDAEK